MLTNLMHDFKVQKSLFYTTFRNYNSAGEMAQWLKAPVVKLEDLNWISMFLIMEDAPYS